MRPELRAWMVACAVGEVLGIALAAVVAFGTAQLWGEPAVAGERFVALALLAAAGAGEGFVLGACQARVLVRRFPGLSRRGWVLATTAPAATAWLVGSLPSTLFAAGSEAARVPHPDPPLALLAALALASGLALGALIGCAQWIVLRLHARRAMGWIAANALAFGCALVWIFVAASLPSAETPLGAVVLLGAVAGALAGLTLGLISGAFLVRLEPR